MAHLLQIYDGCRSVMAPVCVAVACQPTTFMQDMGQLEQDDFFHHRWRLQLLGFAAHLP